METLYKMQLQMGMIISSKYLKDPMSCIQKQLDKYILKYSKSLSGIPLCLAAEGITPTGKIMQNGDIYVKALVSIILLKFKDGDAIEIRNGLLCGIFSCAVDGNDNFTGSFKITHVESSGKIIGTTAEDTVF
ncbi:hypothetical protein ENBRE01_0959 [Enteropsectra breve]|nr:hypothetical protein ENBRE01_0959 [Enteropsectra breve]